VDFENTNWCIYNMETMTIYIINPKAKKIIAGVESLNLISIHNNENDWN
jgi:hypothetical protein